TFSYYGERICVPQGDAGACRSWVRWRAWIAAREQRRERIHTRLQGRGDPFPDERIRVSQDRPPPSTGPRPIRQCQAHAPTRTRLQGSGGRIPLDPSAVSATDPQHCDLAETFAIGDYAVGQPRLPPCHDSGPLVSLDPLAPRR